MSDRSNVHVAPDGRPTCHYCQLLSTIVEPLTRDHIVPVSLGPLRGDVAFVAKRTVRACTRCNGSKGSSRVVREDGSPHCDTCNAAWIAYGPDNWSVKVPTITVAAVVRKALRREAAQR